MPLPSQTCPNNSWCSFQVIDDYTFIVQFIYIIALIAMSLIIIKSYVKLKKNMQQQQQCKQNGKQELFGDIYIKVHYLAFGWLICSLIKVLLNLAVYWIYMSQDFKQNIQLPNIITNTNDQSEPELALMIESSIFTFFDFMCTFFLLLLLIIIPYRWLTIILLSTNQLTQIAMQTRQSLERSFKVLKAIKFYFLYIRQLFPIFLFLQPFLLFLFGVGCWLMIVNVFYINLQIVFLFIFYMYGYYITTKMRKQKLLIMNRNDSSTLKFEYFTLIFILLFRIAINISLRVTGWLSGELNQHCSYNKQKKIFNAISLSFGHSIMHILPILITLYIYRPSVDERKRYSNLLNRQDLQSNNQSTQTIYRQNKRKSIMSYARESEEIYNQNNNHKLAD